MLAGESLLLRLAASGDAAHLGETSLSAAVSPAMSMMPHPASTRAAENAFSGGGWAATDFVQVEREMDERPTIMMCEVDDANQTNI